MRLLGLEINFARKAVPPSLSPPNNQGWFRWPLISEPFTGAWQRNQSLRRENVATYSAVYACVTLISSDISKLGLLLKEQNEEGIWALTTSPSFSPVLRKPNHYQTRIKFVEQWMISKLLSGNTYVLLSRDNRGVVTAMYVLDPNRAKPLVSPDGQVFYELSTDNLAGIDETKVIVPAREIIHDVMSPLFHPLCGISPIVACAVAAAQGLAIQNNSKRLFENSSRPGGILTAPGMIPDDTAKRLKEHWDNNYSGENAGKTAVLGDGLKFESMAVRAIDAQLIEQLKWTAETVCTCFHVPPYMIGVGDMPNYNNIEALNLKYYQQALQQPIECIEALLDEGLGLNLTPGRTLGTEFDLDDLLRMDTATKVKTAVEGLKGIFTPNEARLRFDLMPKPGGDAVYMQQQNFSIEALNKRDTKEDPFASSTGNTGNANGTEPVNDEEEEEEAPDADLEAQAQLAAWELKAALAA